MFQLPKLNTEFQNVWPIMPKNTNYMEIVFGGDFMAQLDLCAAQCVNRFLHDSVCVAAVTHKAEFTFLKPCYVGDLIFMSAKIVEPRTKAIRVSVVGEREKRAVAGRDKVVEASFVFVTVRSLDNIKEKPEFLDYGPHGLTLES